jgi:hypothetical protein
MMCFNCFWLNLNFVTFLLTEYSCKCTLTCPACECFVFDFWHAWAYYTFLFPLVSNRICFYLLNYVLLLCLTYDIVSYIESKMSITFLDLQGYYFDIFIAVVTLCLPLAGCYPAGRFSDVLLIWQYLPVFTGSNCLCPYGLERYVAYLLSDLGVFLLFIIDFVYCALWVMFSYWYTSYVVDELPFLLSL